MQWPAQSTGRSRHHRHAGRVLGCVWGFQPLQGQGVCVRVHACACASARKRVWRGVLDNRRPNAPMAAFNDSHTHTHVHTHTQKQTHTKTHKQVKLEKQLDALAYTNLASSYCVLHTAVKEHTCLHATPACTPCRQGMHARIDFLLSSFWCGRIALVSCRCAISALLLLARSLTHTLCHFHFHCHCHSNAHTHTHKLLLILSHTLSHPLSVCTSLLLAGLRCWG